MKVESAYFTYKYLIYHNVAPVCLSFLFFDNNDPPIRESGIQLDEANLIMTLGVHFSPRRQDLFRCICMERTIYF